jgi:exonuclease III
MHTTLLKGAISSILLISLRLLTLNTEQMPFPFGKEFRTERAQLLSDIILSNKDFDIICLQEVFWEPSRQIFINNLRYKYPYYYVDDSFGKYFIGLNSGLAIFSKYPIVDHISHTYKDYRGVETLAKKGIIGVKLDLSGNNKFKSKRSLIKSKRSFVNVFTTHLQSGIGKEPYIFTLIDKYSPLKGSNMSSIELKESQLKELKKIVQKFCKDGEHIIVAGDLNIDASRSKDYGILSQIMRSLRLKDTFVFTNDSMKSSVLGGKEKRIDYVWSDMVGKSIITETYGNSKTTDHRNVIANLITYDILQN